MADDGAGGSPELAAVMALRRRQPALGSHALTRHGGADSLARGRRLGETWARPESSRTLRGRRPRKLRSLIVCL